MPSSVAFQPWYNLPILGPYGIALTTLTTVAVSVLDADPGRNGVIFANPGTANKRVMPAGSSASDLATAIAALIGGRGGILIYPQSEYQLLKTEGSQFNVNCQWVAVTDDDADGSLTILNFTPATPDAPEVRPTIRQHQQIPVASPVATQTLTIGTGSASILDADPNRHGVQFHNPGTVAIGVCPDNIGASVGAGSIIVLPGATKTIIGNDRVRVNCGWAAAAESGSNNALTALGLFG